MKRLRLYRVAVLSAAIPAAAVGQNTFEVSVQGRRGDPRTGLAVLVAAEPGQPSTLLTNSELVDAGANAQYLVRDTQTGAQLLARIEQADTELDLASLSVPGLQGTPITLALEASEPGRQVRMQPPDGDRRDGHLHSMIERNGRLFYRFSVRPESGETGAPVLNNCGELLSLSRNPDGRGWNREDHAFGIGSELPVIKEFLTGHGIDALIAADRCPSVEERLAEAEAERAALERQRAELEEEARQATEEAERLPEIESEMAELEAELELQQRALDERQGELEEKNRLQAEWEAERVRQEEELRNAEQAVRQAEEAVARQRTWMRYGASTTGALMLIAGLTGWSLMRKRKRRLDASNLQLAAAREELARSSVTFPDVILAGRDPDCGNVRLKINGGAMARSPDGQVLGRSAASADYFVDSQRVSRRHARLIVQEGRLLIEDLDSLNGTRVDGKQSVRGSPVPIRHGSRLELGEVVLTARFVGDDGELTDEASQP